MNENTLAAFTARIGQCLELRRYPPSQDGRWSCSIPNSDIMEDGFLKSALGNGPTPEAAMKDYAEIIAGKRIAIHPTSIRRVEFQVPEHLVGGEA